MGFETEKQNVPEDFTHLGEEFGKGSDFAISFGSSEKGAKIHYPELHFEGENAAHLAKHLAKHGTATIHYKKISSSTHHSVDRSGKEKTRHRVGIQIHGIKHATSTNDKEVEKSVKENPEDSIEKGLEAAESESKSKSNS
jgi:hypothetical protein